MKSFDCPHCHKVFESDSGDSKVVLCPHCNSTVALPEKDLIPGTFMGGFEIIRLLGRGGMGNVYLAKQVSMERLVALKILLRSLTDDKESLEQFLNEARVSGRLNHANIIPAIDAGEAEGTYYLATAYVDGTDLEQRLEKERCIPEKESLAIVLKIAKALSYAWETYGLLHKDIKPGNIMCDKKGEVFLMDMGIAQYIGEGTGGEEHILGSPFFMSPEQTTASPLSWTSDLYSLGATLYNMIVGLPPYDAPEVMRIIEMHTTEPFPEPLTRNPSSEVSKPTVNLMKNMMGKRASDRFDSWSGFIEAAEEALKLLDPKAAKKRAKTEAKKRKSKEGKKKRRSSSKHSRHSTLQRKSNPASSIITYLLLIVIAAGVAYVIYYYHKHIVATKSIDKAERFLHSHPGEYDSIIDQFRQTKLKCRGTKFEVQISERLNELEKEKAAQTRFIREYKDAKKQADQLSKKREYEEALKVMIKASKNLKDPALLREADRKIGHLKKAAERKKKK